MWNQARKFFRENLLLLITLAGVVLGLLLGFILRPLHLGADWLLLLSYPGELFMRLLQLLVLPLIITSLITGCADLKAHGRMAGGILAYFAATSFLSSAIGLALVALIHPGDPDTKRSLNSTSEVIKGQSNNSRILHSFLDLGRNLVPENIFQATTQSAFTSIGDDGSILLKYRDATNTLGIITFCMVFGTLLGTSGPQSSLVIDFFKVIDKVIMRMVTGVIWLTPVGVGSLIASKLVSVVDLDQVMTQLGWFILTVLLGQIFYQLGVLQALYYVVIKKNPFRFYANLVQANLTTFATASTAAALPVTFRCMDAKGIDPRVSRFVLPLGAAVNKDGTAMFVSTAAIFIAQMNSVELGVAQYFTVWLTSTATSVAAASLPSAALVLMMMTLSAINAPVQDVSLLFAVDWFLDRVRTTNNMLGDCYGAAILEHFSREQLATQDSRTQAEESYNSKNSSQSNSNFCYVNSMQIEDSTN